jgi:predicted ATPase
VQCLLSSNGIIVIEQPEIHVHPRLQAELADLLVASVVDRRNQLLVETHSEHLLLRLQRRLRTSLERGSNISPDDICILYVDSLADGRAAVTHIPVGQDGQFLKEWPEGFFEERYNEMFT